MRTWQWLSALVAALAGCQQLAGDFQVERTPAEGEATECPASTTRCNGEFLLACSDDGSTWVLRDTCAREELCDSETGRCRRCLPGELRCDGALRQECSASGDDWEAREPCGSEALCNPTHCGSCTPGEYGCRGTDAAAGRELWVCGEDETWSIPVETCATPSLCELGVDGARDSASGTGACAAPRCDDPGAYRCEGQVLERCRLDLTGWEILDTCASAGLCALGIEASLAEEGVVDVCPSGCPGALAFACEGMTLVRCREDLTAWDVVLTCEPGSECNPVQGACSERCEPGEYQCNAETLRRCNAERNWEPVETCASAALCSMAPDGQSAACGTPACPNADMFQCEGAELYRCRDDLLGWEHVEACVSAELCSALDRRCDAPVCAPDELRCFGSELRRCSAGLRDWELVARCATGEYCDNSSDDPGCKLECPSETRCNGGELESCTTAGWIHRANCATSELCSCTLGGTCELGSGGDGCGQPVCGGSQASYRCRGTTLDRCETGRNGWETSSTCATAALCDAAAGVCTSPTCNTGQRRCNGTEPQQCREDRTGWESAGASCASAALCTASGTCTTPACAVGQRRCNGAQPEVCNADRNGFVASGAACATVALCTASGTCTTPACAVGQRRCNGAQPEVCNADRSGFVASGAACASAALCTASGTCTTPACAVGQRRCNGAQPEVCNADRSGFVASGAACASAALCTASGTCTTPACAVGQRRCNGAQPEVCNADRSGFVASGAACASAALCTASGTCTAPACAVGERRCDGAQPEVCNSSRTGWQADGASCASSALCSGGRCTSPACGTGEYECQGVTLRRCNADRTGFEDVERCSNANLCDAAVGRCETPVCAAGAYRCDGAALQRCADDERAWTTRETCASSELCDAAGEECDDCRAPSFDCTGNVLSECSAAGSWSMLADCGTGQCDSMLGVCVPEPPPDGGT